MADIYGNDSDYSGWDNPYNGGGAAPPSALLPTPTPARVNPIADANNPFGSNYTTPPGSTTGISVYAPPAFTPSPSMPKTTPILPFGGSTQAAGSGNIWAGKSADDFLADWRSKHAASEGIGPLDAALRASGIAGYGGRYMVNGVTPSNNEVVINGKKVKVISGEDNPATAGWYYGGEDGGGSGGGTDLTSLLSQLGGSSFTDPETKALLDFINGRVSSLTAPINDPNYDRYTQAANDLVTQLQAKYVNPNSATAQTTLEDILKQVTGAPFSDDQSQALQAEAFDNLTRSRDSDVRNTIAHAAMLGQGKGSGTIQDALRQVEDTYQTNRATNQRALTIAGIQQENANRATAAQVAQALHDLTQGDEQMNESRSGQAVATLQALTQSGTARRAEEDARGAEATQLMQIPVQLGDQRLQQALQVLGLANSSGGDMNSILQTLASIASQSQANSNTQANDNAAFWEQIAGMVA